MILTFCSLLSLERVLSIQYLNWDLKEDETFVNLERKHVPAVKGCPGQSALRNLTFPEMLMGRNTVYSSHYFLTVPHYLIQNKVNISFQIFFPGMKNNRKATFQNNTKIFFGIPYSYCVWFESPLKCQSC